MSAALATSRAPGRSAPESDKRRQILEGARAVFMASGFDGASMGEIARTAGVSKGTLYVYFDSKERLFEALALEQKRALAEVLFQFDADDPDVRGALTRLGHSYLAEMVRPEHVTVIRMVVGASEKFPRLGQAFFEAGPVQGAMRLGAYLDTQVAAGRLRPADTNLAARQFLHLCQAGLLTRLLLGAGNGVTADEVEHHVTQAVRVFLAGYAADA